MIRVALAMLTRDPVRYLGVTLGVFFCAFLITYLLSTFVGVLARTASGVADFPQADVWVMDPAVEYVDEIASLGSGTAQVVRGIPGVDWAVNLYSGSLRVRLPGGRFRGVQVYGLDDATLIGAPTTMIQGSLADLRQPDAIIVDRRGAETLLRVPTPGGTRSLAVGDEVLINDRRAIVVGIAEVPPRLLSKAIIFTTYSRATTFAPPERRVLSFVLVRAAAGQSPDALAQRIADATGLRARSHRQFSRDTAMYFIRTTDFIPQMAVMVLLGGTVGFAITGLLLYMFTSDNQRLYATFKAIGAHNRTVGIMVLAQALVAGAAGFGTGTGAAMLLGRLVRTADVPFLPTWWAVVASGAMVLLICVVSAMLSARKVLRLEPGMVFRA